MRKNLKSLAPTLWFVIIAFIISIFAVWGGAGRLGEGRGTDILATVGKEKISVSLYSQTLRQRLEAMRQEFRELDSRFIQQLNIPQQILNQLIQQSLLSQLAKEMGIRATDQEIRKKIMSYPVFQKDGQFVGFSQYKRILEWNRIPLSAFEQSLREEIVMEKIINVLTAGVAITKEELWENYKNTHETAKMEYVILELDKVEFDEEPALSVLQEHFENNKEKHKIPEKREADYVFLKTDDLKEEIELTDPELEDYYEDNTARFKEPEKVKVSRIYIPFEEREKDLILNEAKDILDQINKGEDFGEIAKMRSKDEKAQDSGDWGLYEWKTLSRQEQDQVNRLSQGEVSDVVELEDGVAILKVTEKEPESIQPLETVKDRIINILKDQKARDLADQRMAQLEKAAKKEHSLDVAAQKLGYTIKNSGLLKQNDPIEDIDPSGSLSTTLYTLDEREISSLIYTYKGVGLAQLMRIDPTRQADFEEVKEDVTTDFKALKKKERAAQRITAIREELNRKSLEELAEEQNLEYKTINEHKRGQYIGIIGENREIDHLAFSLPLNQPSDPVEFEAGYALIRVLDRKEATQDEFEKENEGERENYVEMKKNKFFSSYMSRLKGDKEIKIKYDLFLKVNSDVLSRFGGEQEQENF
ncbi:MAG: SurA N-terminal domain-containing protein [Candidatus Aminicenantes bacterium]|nr:SurA N-terminal domain-containing protein [Candidatus Aminicenantes bacterium]MDH5384104.1 SurA N-terminal domain-containing protein [Candidatus Aminicenantes bacterium]